MFKEVVLVGEGLQEVGGIKDRPSSLSRVYSPASAIVVYKLYSDRSDINLLLTRI